MKSFVSRSAVLACCLSLTGCAMPPLDLHGDGFAGPTSTFSQHVRPTKGDINSAGFSTKANEIESSLGAR
jgi:hypothetical protein